MDQKARLFSEGTYHCSMNDESIIRINRTRKYMEGVGLQDHSSVHPYTLDLDEYLHIDGKMLKHDIIGK